MNNLNYLKYFEDGYDIEFDESNIICSDSLFIVWFYPHGYGWRMWPKHEIKWACCNDLESIKTHFLNLFNKSFLSNQYKIRTNKIAKNYRKKENETFEYVDLSENQFITEKLKSIKLIQNFIDLKIEIQALCDYISGSGYDFGAFVFDNSDEMLEKCIELEKKYYCLSRFKRVLFYYKNSKIVNQIIEKIMNLKLHHDILDWPPSLPLFESGHRVLYSMIHQLEYVEDLEVVLTKISNVDSIDDLDYLEKAFGKAAWAEYYNDHPGNPACQTRMFLRDDTKYFWTAKKAELGDLKSLYDLVEYMMFNGSYGPENTEKGLQYLGEKGIYEAYLKLSIEFSFKHGFNCPKHFDLDFEKAKLYYLKALECINNSNNMTIAEKGFAIMKVVYDLVEFGKADESYYDYSRNAAKKIYENYDGIELLRLACCYLTYEVEHKQNFELAALCLKKFESNVNNDLNGDLYQYIKDYINFTKEERIESDIYNKLSSYKHFKF